MARKGAEMKPIEGNSELTLPCSIRRKNLFRRTEEFCASTNAEAALIVFSKGGNAFAFGCSAVEAVLGPYIVEQPSTAGRVAEDSQLTDAEMERRLREAIATARPAWDVATKDLGFKGLGVLEEEVKEILNLAMERKREAVMFLP